MWAGIIAKAEKATAWAGRYCDLEHAARWYKVALVIGTTAWATRWILVAFLATDLLGSDGASAQTLTEIAPQSDTVQKTVFYAAAILTCMAIKWAGWTYGGVGYVHQRSKNSLAS